MIPDLPVLEELSRVAKALSRNGWAEANAGNISVRVPDLSPEEFDVGPLIESDSRYPLLAGRAVLVTRSGSRMRDIAEDPKNNMILVKVEYGAYSILAGEGRPTYEMPIHLSVHDMLLTSRPENKAVIHAHPTDLLAFCQLGINDISGTLYKVHPEAYFHVPDGIEVVDYLVPGSDELAEASVAALESAHIAVWNKHGAISTGETLSDCLDVIEIVNKAAAIYLSAVTAGAHGPAVGLSEEEIEITLAARDSLSE